MTDSILLKQKIKESGFKMGYIVEQLNTSYGWLNKKINNEKPFKAEEIQALCDVLSITDFAEKERIFFANNVEKTST